jgi:hypothetical protein
MGGKFRDSIRKSIFYTNLGADRRGFDRNARIESPKHSLRFQLGHSLGRGMREKEEPPRALALVAAQVQPCEASRNSHPDPSNDRTVSYSLASPLRAAAAR